MSTSDPGELIITDASPSAAAAGLPDVALVAAWANQLFRAGPTSSGEASESQPAAVGAAAPAGAPAEPSLAASALAPRVSSGADVPAASPVQPPATVPTNDLPRTLPSTSFNALPFAHGSQAISQALPQPTAIASASPRPVPNTAEFPTGAELPWAALPVGLDGLGPSARAPSSQFYFLEQAGVGPSPAVPPAVPPKPSGFAVPADGSLNTLNAPAASVAQPSTQPSAQQGLGQAADAPHKPQPSLGRGVFDARTVARDFPILRERVNGKRLVWLDNAATTQKPQAVIDRLSYFYEHENSNVHRGAHTLAARSSDAYEAARDKVRKFVGAPSAQEVVFVRGATEGINLVAQSWGRRYVRAGDEIVISWLEHHSNIVPWQQLCAETGAKLRVVPVSDTGEVLLDEYQRLLSSRTRLVALTHVSNALGTVLPVQEMTAIAHRYGARVLIDGAQAVSHFRVNVQAIDCDFYVLSGHKLFAPTGIGALYGKSEVLDSMPPWQGGGNMIADVTFEKTVYHGAPARFEAGTGNIADAVGLGAAIDYLESIGFENAARHEHELLEYGQARLAEIPRLRQIGTAKEKAGVMSFVIDGIPTEQIGAHLAREGIAVRAGHHCAQPALRRFGLESTVRPSLAFYNTHEDIDALIAALRELQSGW